MLLRQLFEAIDRTGQGNTAVMGWGRGMGHKGHMLLARAVLHHAQEMDAKAYFVVSRTSLVDPATGQPWADRPTFTKTKDDPLTPEEKLATYRKVFPQNAEVFSVASADASTLDKVLAKIAGDGFSKVILVVGELEKDSFSFLTRPDKSGVPPYQRAGLKDLEIISRQDTKAPGSDPTAPDYQQGPRATPMRAVLADPSKSEEEQFAVWRDAMPDNLSDDEVMDLMNKAKQRMAAVPAAKNAKKAKQAVAEGPTDDPSFQKMMGKIQKSTPTPISGYVALTFASEGRSKKIRGVKYNGKPMPDVIDDPEEFLGGKIEFTPDQIEQELMSIGEKYGWDSIDPGQGQGYTEMFFDTSREYTSNNQSRLAANIVRTVNEINKFFNSINRSLQSTGLPGYTADVWQGMGPPDNINQIEDLRQITSIAKTKGVAEVSLDEGVNDPHTFKCIFLFGPMGAGKSTVARPLLTHTGLRSVNLDNFNELFIKKGQVPTGHLAPDQLEKSWQLSQTQQQNFTDGRLGIIIDGSGRNPETAIGVIEKLMPLGYEFMMIFVNVSEATSIARQQSRAAKQQQQWGVGRQVEPELAKNTYDQVQKNLAKYSAYFGPQRFVYVDNEKTPDLTQATKKVEAFLRAPVKQPEALAWIQSQKGGDKVAQQQKKLGTAQDSQQKALKQYKHAGGPLNPKFAKKGMADDSLDEGPSLPSTLKSIATNGEPITQLYGKLKAMAKRWVDNNGSLKGFHRNAAGQSAQWFHNFYFDKLQADLYALSKQAPRYAAPLINYLKDASEDRESRIAFTEISRSLPPILFKMGKQMGDQSLTQFAYRWNSRREEYESYLANLEAEADTDDEYDEPEVKPEKNKVPGQQNAQVEQIVNDILAKLPKNIAGDIRNAIARAPNKLQALHQELSKRKIQGVAEATSAAVRMQRAWERQQAKSAASRKRGEELLNPKKKEEPNFSDKDDEEEISKQGVAK